MLKYLEVIPLLRYYSNVVTQEYEPWFYYWNKQDTAFWFFANNQNFPVRGIGIMFEIENIQTSDVLNRVACSKLDSKYDE